MSWSRQVRRTFNRVRTRRQWRDPARVKSYLSMCRQVVQKADCTLKVLERRGIAYEEISRYLRHAKRQIDQVERRLIKGEVIAHGEKVFSVHEEHTRWISKGKAGVVAELGVPVCVLADQYQFILRHHIQWEAGDQDMIVPFLTEAKKHYPTLRSCSLDRGFYTPTPFVQSGQGFLHAEESGAAGPATRFERHAQEGPAHSGGSEEGDGRSLCGSAAPASGDRVGHGQFESPRAGAGAYARFQRVCPDGGLGDGSGQRTPNRSIAEEAGRKATAPA